MNWLDPIIEFMSSVWLTVGMLVLLAVPFAVVLYIIGYAFYIIRYKIWRGKNK